MQIDPDKLKGKQTLEVLESAMDELVSAVSDIQEALANAGDSDLDREEREDYRSRAADLLADLFGEFETLQALCAKKLTYSTATEEK